MSVCVTFVVVTDCESSTRPISTNPVSMEAVEYGLTRGTCFFLAPSRGGRGRRAAVDLVMYFGVGRTFSCFSVNHIFKFVHEYTTAGCERPRAVSVD